MFAERVFPHFLSYFPLFCSVENHARWTKLKHFILVAIVGKRNRKQYGDMIDETASSPHRPKRSLSFVYPYSHSHSHSRDQGVGSVCSSGAGWATTINTNDTGLCSGKRNLKLSRPTFSFSLPKKKKNGKRNCRVQAFLSSASFRQAFPVMQVNGLLIPLYGILRC